MERTGGGLDGVPYRLSAVETPLHRAHRGGGSSHCDIPRRAACLGICYEYVRKRSSIVDTADIYRVTALDLTPKSWANRAGHLAALQMPLLVALSSKNSVITGRWYDIYPDRLSLTTIDIWHILYSNHRHRSREGQSPRLPLRRHLIDGLHSLTLCTVFCLAVSLF